MTNPNLKVRRKQKITYAASVEGIEAAKKALKRLGFDSKSNFSKSQLISRSTVTKFFQRQPIQLDSFNPHWRDCAKTGKLYAKGLR